MQELCTYIFHAAADHRQHGSSFECTSCVTRLMFVDSQITSPQKHFFDEKRNFHSRLATYTSRPAPTVFA